MIISNCVVTQSDAEILHYFVESKSDELYKTYKKLCLGVDVKLGKTLTPIYSLFPGKVVYVGHTGKVWSVIIAYNNCQCVKYDNLSKCDIKLGEDIDTQDVVGQAKDFLHFEYLNGTPSNWPVRIEATTLYKHDPLFLLTDGYASIIDYAQEVMDIELGHSEDDELPESVVYMLSDNESEAYYE